MTDAAIPLAPPEQLERTWRILVIDDDADHVWSLGKILELDGHDVRIAFDGTTALATANSFLPELTISGIAMGQTDSYEICRRLRGTPEGGRMVIAALSRFGNETARLRSRMAGFDIHLVKTIDFRELKIILTDLMLRPH